MHVLRMVNSPKFYEQVPEFIPVREAMPSVMARVKAEASQQSGCKACGVIRKVQQAVIDLFVNALIAKKQDSETIAKLRQYLSGTMGMAAEKYILICRKQNSNERLQVTF